MSVEIDPPAKQATDGRAAYMKCPGFILFTHVGDTLLDYMGEEAGLPFAEKNYSTLLDDSRGLFNSNVGLSLIIAKQMNQVPHRGHDSEIGKKLSNQRCHFYGLTEDEKAEAAKHTYDFGLDDLEFPWHFSAGLATAAIHSFTGLGMISKDEAANLSISDWANIIDSNWFSELTHDLALTGFGVYRSFGKELADYKYGALMAYVEEACHRYTLIQPEMNILKAYEKEDPEKSLFYLATRLDPAYKPLLRTIRQKSSHLNPKIRGKSIGCPVARTAAILPADYETSMPRAQRLIELGHLSVSETGNGDGTVLATQEESVIDRTLGFIAKQLREYDREYGTPILTDTRVKHARLPVSKVLIRA